MISIPLVELRPNWVEFTQTKGVLRILQPKESKWQRSRAQGLVFECPRCLAKSKNGRAHNCIFLFDFGNVPKDARPQPRFIPEMWYPTPAKDTPREPADFTYQTLVQAPECPHTEITEEHYHLTPGDLKCGWHGYVRDGVVSWKPNFLENLKQKWK